MAILLHQARSPLQQHLQLHLQLSDGCKCAAAAAAAWPHWGAGLLQQGLSQTLMLLQVQGLQQQQQQQLKAGPADLFAGRT
jgi:hypothetical protein